MSKDGAESPKGEGRALQGVGRRRQGHPAPGQEEAEDRLQRPLPRTRVLKEMDRPERKTHREPSEGRRERGWPGGGLGTRYCLGTECGAGAPCWAREGGPSGRAVAHSWGAGKKGETDSRTRYVCGTWGPSGRGTVAAWRNRALLGNLMQPPPPPLWALREPRLKEESHGGSPRGVPAPPRRGFPETMSECQTASVVPWRCSWTSPSQWSQTLPRQPRVV